MDIEQLTPRERAEQLIESLLIFSKDRHDFELLVQTATDAIESAVQQEREECAKVAEVHKQHNSKQAAADFDSSMKFTRQFASQACGFAAEAIRARSTPPAQESLSDFTRRTTGDLMTRIDKIEQKEADIRQRELDSLSSTPPVTDNKEASV